MPGLLHVTQQSCTVGAGRLNTDTLERSKGAHPGEHLLVAVSGCREALACQHPIQLIDNGRDMKILVRIDAADDTTGRPLLPSILALPARQKVNGSTRAGCLDRTVTRQNVRPFLGHLHR